MSSLPPDPYKILGVSDDAQLPEIRSAHRKLVLKCHPDKIQDPTLKAQKQDEFQKVQQAYELLTDENERQRYDDQVRQRARVAELRKQMQAKANSSSPRTAATYKYEIRTPERPSSYKSSTAESPPSGKVYASYSRSYDEEGRSPRFFEPEIRNVRREASYDKPSKRESEKERERERALDRERALERERRLEKEKNEKRREEAIRRAEKEAKEVRRAEKKAREKQHEKDRKREAEEKRRHASPYIEDYEEMTIPIIKTEKKKKSSSKKHDEKRERSTHREEIPPPTSAMNPPPIPQDRISSNLDYAASYIEASRQKPSGHRSAAAFHTRHIQPPAPTPPPAPGQSSPFAVPDEDEPRRSSAKPRRGSSGEKTYRKPSREALGDADIVDVSPRPSFQKSSTTIPMSSSPPRHNLPRTYTTPIDPSFTRPIPISRSQTYNGGGYETSDPRGRARSKLQAQVEEESDYEENYESRHRTSKHRSSKKHRSPERTTAAEYVQHYSVNGTRAKPSKSGAYRHPDDAESYGYYPSRHAAESSRPSMPVREPSYSNAPGGLKFPKVKTAKAYGYDDVAYSAYQPPYRDDYASAYA
ncbi:Fc.00g075590.m01.CDS01 [Cosmosporella sp. VM-42]